MTLFVTGPWGKFRSLLVRVHKSVWCWWSEFKVSVTLSQSQYKCWTTVLQNENSSSWQTHRLLSVRTLCFTSGLLSLCILVDAMRSTSHFSHSLVVMQAKDFMVVCGNLVLIPYFFFGSPPLSVYILNLLQKITRCSNQRRPVVTLPFQEDKSDRRNYGKREWLHLGLATSLFGSRRSVTHFISMYDVRKNRAEPFFLTSVFCHCLRSFCSQLRRQIDWKQVINIWELNITEIDNPDKKPEVC